MALPLPQDVEFPTIYCVPKQSLPLFIAVQVSEYRYALAQYAGETWDVDSQDVHHAPIYELVSRPATHRIIARELRRLDSKNKP